MRKEVVLAIAVLSVLAGLLTIGYAQNPNDDGPDAFELRREAIDRIEAAYTGNDIEQLEKLIEVGDFHNAIEAKKKSLALPAWKSLNRLKRTAPQW